MPKTKTPHDALIAQALKMDSKSEGMRFLYEKGFTATEVRDAYGVPYGFAYGVGVKAGFIDPTPREPKAAPAKTKAAPTKAAAPAKAKAATATAARPARAAARPAARRAK